MTPAQAAASRATGFNYRMAQGANTKFDNAEYVPGSKPTLAEQTADPTLAAQQRVMADNNKDFSAHDQANNEARIDYFDSLAGTPTTLEALESAREDQAAKDIAAAFENKSDANAQPVVDLIKQRLAGPAGKLSPVRQALTEVSDALQKADGSGPETDPEMLYGVRKQINYLLSKNGQRANPGYADATVTSNLQAVKSALDDAIEPAAPGYQKYLENYAAASRPIDTQEFLQSWRQSLLSQGSKLTLSGVNRMMKDIGGKLSADGVNTAKSIDDDTMEGLFNLRQDLLRESNRTLGKHAGSDTQQNQTIAGELGMNAAHGMAHIAASHIPGGNLLASPAIARGVASSNARIKNHLTNRLLNSLPLEPNPLAVGVNTNPPTSYSSH
jgi:hypothetical protein